MSPRRGEEFDVSPGSVMVVERGKMRDEVMAVGEGRGERLGWVMLGLGVEGYLLAREGREVESERETRRTPPKLELG